MLEGTIVSLIRHVEEAAEGIREFSAIFAIILVGLEVTYFSACGLHSILVQNQWPESRTNLIAALSNWNSIEKNHLASRNALVLHNYRVIIKPN